MGERDIITAALRKGEATELQAYHEKACGADAALRRHPEGLPPVGQNAGSFLECRPGGLGATLDHPVREAPGTVIGPYKLLAQIGEGGMGIVWMAEQTQPVRRQVALKVIKPGMDSRQVIARFEAERQALAMMDHVNIARVLDAGTTEAGLPYFVMELVHGVPITKYCDDNPRCRAGGITPASRLRPMPRRTLSVLSVVLAPQRCAGLPWTCGGQHDG
jgi:eukaryotic-like serine/threonine-protein kinase